VLFEIRTSIHKPGSVHRVEARVAERLARRTELSPLGAYWHVEIGPLNQIVQVWPYEDAAHRARVRDSLGDDDRPLEDDDDTVSQMVDLWRPASFMPPFRARVRGGIFEMRTYTFRPGTLPLVLAAWEKAIPDRARVSPLVAAWTSETGALHRFCHVWAYPGLDERARLRREALELPDWPPMTREWRVAEESTILLPAPFSPIR
jgi:hypothetical protein